MAKKLDTNNLFRTLLILFAILNVTECDLCDDICDCSLLYSTKDTTKDLFCTDIPKESLPEEIINLKVFGNIHSLEPLRNMSIKNLDLSSCNIFDIKPNAFSNNQHIMTLVLSNNEIMWINEETFRDLTSLEVLFLDGNGIKIIMDGSLEHLKNLRILDLADNCLLEMPGKLPESLIQLHLENNTIESMAIERIANLKNLELLDLNKNEIKVWSAGNTSLQGLTKLSLGEGINTSNVKKTNFPNLQNLQILGQALSLSLLNTTVQEAISTLTSIEYLHIGNYEVTTFNFMRNLTNLRELVLENVHFPEKGIAYFPVNLTTLVINSSPEVAKQVLQAAGPFQRLSFLSLQNDDIRIITNEQSSRILGKVRKLHLNSNPLNCTQSNWDWLVDKIKKIKNYLGDRDGIKCYEPATARGQTLSDFLNISDTLNVYPNDFTFVNHTKTHNANETKRQSNVTSGIILFIIFLLIFLLLNILCIKVMRAVQRKLQYDRSSCGSNSMQTEDEFNYNFVEIDLELDTNHQKELDKCGHSKKTKNRCI